MSRDLPEHTEHVRAHDLELAKAGLDGGVKTLSGVCSDSLTTET